MSLIDSLRNDFRRFIDEFRANQTIIYNEISDLKTQVSQQFGKSGFMYHGKRVTNIVNVTNLLNLNNPQNYVWTNVYTKTVYLSKFSISPVNGNPQVLISANNQPLTASQNQSQPTVYSAQALTLYDPFDYSANYPEQEIPIDATHTFEVQVVGGTGTVLLQYTINVPEGED